MKCISLKNAHSLVSTFSTFHSAHRHAFEVLPVPYPVVPWVVPKPEHKPANFRIDDSKLTLLESGMGMGPIIIRSLDFEKGWRMPKVSPNKLILDLVIIHRPATLKLGDGIRKGYMWVGVSHLCLFSLSLSLSLFVAHFSWISHALD